MSYDNALGLILSILVAAYLVFALIAPREALMSGWLQLLLIVALLAVSTPVLGTYLAKVYANGPAPGDRVFGPIDRPIYRVTGVDPEREQRWNMYALSLLAFSAVSVLILYAQLRLQKHLSVEPAKPERACPPDCRSTPR